MNSASNPSPLAPAAMNAFEGGEKVSSWAVESWPLRPLARTALTPLAGSVAT